MMRSILAAAATAALIMPAMAEDTQIGPTVGEAAPAFAAVAADGTAVDLAAISGSEGAILVFSRSLDWCPFCKTQATDLETAAADLTEAGWALNLITYDTPETLQAFGEAEGLSYTLLSDTDSAMIDAFGLRNAEVPAGSRFDGIPHPAIVYVSADGNVEAVLREEGYKDRPANEVVISTAQSLTVQ
ncbi:redoxin domain-containing protein [Hyphomonas sp. FCG-A18]|jgi:peroxiredoxin Q/BCP|uniref:redoxin domain-containing protein n=1 Tax=Hyphomonas sp. FCG-A18 TaxID=3080019 RepID=UPI002B301A9A|nr:redoxin domain-containing protein [Hyphomonas sp. FCG-A18]